MLLVAHQIGSELGEVDVERVLSLGDEALWNWVAFFEWKAEQQEKAMKEAEKRASRKR